MTTVTTISGHQRHIPAAMATQHPDNANKPSWSTRSDGKITLEMEGEEAFRNFSLGVQETMWDNEGKHADYGIGLKLVETYEDYFTEHQIGRDAYITYRIPNRWMQKGGIHRHVFTAIAAENETLASYGFHSHAFFEVILPFTEDPYQLLGVQMDYVLNNSGRRVPEYLEVIPLIEGPARLIDIQDILEGYVRGMRRIWNTDVRYVRPFAARSDPAMDSGLVAADLFALGSVSEFEQFSQRMNIPVYPIMGAGACVFRGGLAPDRIDDFIQKYPGFRTVTVQSAFRYDYPEESVRTAVAKLNELLPQSAARVMDEREMNHVHELMDIFSTPYKSTVTQRENGRMPIADTIIEVADKFIPSHRQRAGHTGQFAYARSVENAAEVELPRAIKYCAAFMALGIPPEVIGVGRGIEVARERGLMGDLEAMLPLLQADLSRALRYVNEDALAHFAQQSEAWARVRDDVRLVAEYTGQPVGPQTPDEVRHLNHTRNFVELLKRWGGNPDIAEEMTDEVLKAAKRRQYLG
ncbi:MAG: phosphoenolpyruvate carboxylase [Dehalococcoidia bacterium]|nr:phosphoenolpyruvate carboxylase [Dehalococcoidia bacterium]